MENSEGKYIRWSEDCVWNPVGDTLAVVKVPPPDIGCVITEEVISGIVLNSIGRDIWDLCNGTRTFEDIVSQLLAEYKGDTEKIRDDIQTTVSQLKEESFLTYEDTSKAYNPVTLPLQGYPVWGDNVIWNEIEGKIMAINDDTGVPFELKDEMGELWKLCDGSITIGEIMTRLEEKGTINEDMPPGGFTLFLKQWLALGLLTVKRL
jgi:hypothetical protein